MTDSTDSAAKSRPSKSKERQFKGLSMAERQQARREKLIEAGIEAYGRHGFFQLRSKISAMKPS